ncbi:MAG: hypothetical protein HC922_06700 [Leptolyngbyaceae cyanobacterium SM2_3_12]|nr:hypothetical protein [Leptolyngbyaceae cyanobacterium SM2_3_12]
MRPTQPTSSFLSWLQASMGTPTAELHTKLRGNICMFFVKPLSHWINQRFF